MKKLIVKAVFFFAIISISYFNTAAVVKAAGGEPVYGQPVYGQPVYGGGVIVPRGGQVLIDKTVQNPASGFMVDHLGPLDPKYRPKQFITFNIVVRNPGDQTLSRVEVKDIFPKKNGQKLIDFMTGPGEYDSSNDTLNFTVNDLEAGGSRNFTIKGRIVHPSLLAQFENVICTEPGNIVEASADSQSDRDENRFCIEKEMIVPSVPPAGPQDWLISLAGLSTIFVGGLYLRKKAYQG